MQRQTHTNIPVMAADRGWLGLEGKLDVGKALGLEIVLGKSLKFGMRPAPEL